MRSIVCLGGRQRLQERSDEGARARCVEAFRGRCAVFTLSEPRGLPALRFAAAPAARQLRYAGGVSVV